MWFGGSIASLSLERRNKLQEFRFCCRFVTFLFASLRTARVTRKWTRVRQYLHTRHARTRARTHTHTTTFYLFLQLQCKAGPVPLSIMDPSFEAAAVISCLFMRIFSTPSHFSFSHPLPPHLGPERRWGCDSSVGVRGDLQQGCRPFLSSLGMLEHVDTSS
jgi:hypothetical protein